MKTVKRFMETYNPIISFKIRHNRDLHNFEKEMKEILDNREKF